MATNMELFSTKAGLCIVDMQEKLAAAMPEKVLKGTLRNCLNLIEAARVLHMPIVVSEQYPKGLGRTLPVVAESVLRLPRDQVFFADKIQFSCVGLAPFDAWMKKCNRMQWIISGMETHVCIFQTVRAMVDLGYEIFVPRDAVVSRTMANWEIALQLMDRCGAIITSTETVIFDLIKQAGTEQFKQLSHIIK
jgi:nicotinamidase-related amidase